MTDPFDLDPVDPIDDLASAHLDGLTTPEEAQRVASDPAAAARIAAFAAVRRIVGVPGQPVDATQREVAINAALAAFAGVDASAPSGDEPSTTSPVEPPVEVPLDAEVGSLADAAARRSLRRRGLVAAVAAAIAAVAVIAPTLANRDDGHDGRVVVASPDLSGSRTSIPSEDDAPPTTDRATGPDTGSVTGSTSKGHSGTRPHTPHALAASAAVPVDLGPRKDLPALASAARAQLAPADTAITVDEGGPTTTVAAAGTATTVDAGSTTTTAADGPKGSTTTTTVAPTTTTTAAPTATAPSTTVDPATQACFDEAEHDAAGRDRTVVLTGRAELHGQPVAVVVTEDKDGKRTLTATDPADECSVVGSSRL